MIHQVVLYSNGMVMVFDYNGEQIPELQGRFLDVRGLILKLVNDTTEFYIGDWNNGTVRMNKECFSCEAWNQTL